MEIEANDEKSVELENCFREIRSPTQVIWGKNDEVIDLNNEQNY